MKDEKNIRVMKKFVIFVLLAGFVTMASGCASMMKYGFCNTGVDTAARREVKVEVLKLDESLFKLPKELSVEVVALPDADPALSEAVLEAMKRNVIAEFEREGWVICEGAPLELIITLSKCNRKEIAGEVLFKKEEDVVASLLATLVRSKKLAAWHATTTYVTENQLRMAFVVGIIQAITQPVKPVS